MATKVRKEVKYLNRDFGGLRNDLIEFAKTYYPDTYNDFNEASPGMMFIEMAAYVGDVLSYYVDKQFQENLLAYAQELSNVYAISQAMGYRPRGIRPSFGTIQLTQQVPAIGSGANNRPDLRFGSEVLAGSTFTGAGGVTFSLTDDVNFKASSSRDEVEFSIFQTSGGEPLNYLITKDAPIVSGQVGQEVLRFGAAEKYQRVQLSQVGITEIISIVDSDNNNWTEVPFLAQDTVFVDSENNADNSPLDSDFADSAPYLLKLKKVSRRYTKYSNPDGTCELRFGAGVSDNPDEEIIPNPDNVGSSLPGGVSQLGKAFDPSNFLKTKAYGVAPANTNLTVKYRFGGGVKHNVTSNSITSISKANFGVAPSNLNATLVSTTQQSLICNNEEPTSGGKGAETILEIKQNALANLQSQGRMVTKDDYQMRALSMPAKYGSIAKVYIVQDEQLEEEKPIQQGLTKKSLSRRKRKNKVRQLPQKKIPNPLALNFYLLSYNANKKFIPTNEVVKRNLVTYMAPFRMMTDAINIKDAFVINIAVRFSIVTRTGFNKQEVLIRCIDRISNYFNPDNWQINQPIEISELQQELGLVEGVGTLVPPVDDNPENKLIIFKNKYKISEGYSGNLYDIDSATKDSVIYPSLDPSIFELKFPGQDIEGNVVGDSAGSAGATGGGSGGSGY